MSYRILIVDENQLVIDEIQENLEKKGYSVCWAKNEKDAVQRLNSEKIDLLICSVKCEDINGFKIIELIKKSNNFISTQVILLTDHLCKEELVKGKQLGIEGYFQKPVDFSELCGKIGKLLCTEGIIKKLRRILLSLKTEGKNLKINHDNVLQKFRYERTKRHDQMVSRQREMWKISVNIKGKKYSSDTIAREESKRFEKIQEQVEKDRDFIRAVDAKIQSIFQELQDKRSKNSESLRIVQQQLSAITQ